ncbi:PREDICTED: tyrosyl-DNA phosphodiesterase 2 isoform X2 [Ipomoea nil]|uniref:tyrosyl-DNA phosphodiesterase 2 isoform X2 n=1 Tax=Ipomoea nil TaxID=35883 RepID=UPI000901AD95|nr:PREDICTED: tyrosyl-DNA phosphodiesterase 2 isoform X2 [Ipomoea nil]
MALLPKISAFLLLRPLLFSQNPNKKKPFFAFTKTMSSWTCSTCTFINPPTQKSACEICLSAAPAPSPSSSISPEKPKWSCAACTFLNPFRSTRCEICGTRASAASLSTLLETGDDDQDVDPSVGSVFFPLRSCNSSSSSIKKKLDLVGLDDGVAIDITRYGSGTDSDKNGSSDAIGSRAENNKRKRREELVVVEDDGIDLLGFKDVKAGKKVANESLNVVEQAPSKTSLHRDPKILKILTYNVWFREDLEMHKRMEAIGDLIELHSPDIICFQEVIPEIYDIFQRSRWWKVYRCSVSSNMEFTGAYFCMQLTKLSVKSFSSKPFDNSIMGRRLCSAEIEVAKDLRLVVATSHLESPCPAPPKWDQMFSKERVDQAKAAIKVLEQNPNVIFCGDMNWDDKLDGPFPLPEGWIDVWTELRPGEIGYTYDTKTNKMLTGNRTLQKRLDRFICSLRDFKINKIEMIGKDPIPGLFYCKEKKVRNEVKKLTLPVLPSDHYGLLLEIRLP